MPWYGWAYLVLLALIGAGSFVAELRAGRPRLAIVRVAAVSLLAAGVALYFRGEGAGLAYGIGLLCAVGVLAHKTFDDARIAERAQLPPAARLGAALGQLSLLPAAVLGALAFWAGRGG